VFGNIVLRKILGAKVKEIVGGWEKYKMGNFII
jgi:hypothetical protein